MRPRAAVIIFLLGFLGSLVMLAAAAVFGAVFIGLFTAVISLGLVIFFASTVYSIFFGAPFVPATSEHVEEMIAMARLKPGEKAADLGSGDGRLVIAAAKAGARAEGWEISPFLWLLSLWNIFRARVRGRATARLGNYWQQRFGDVKVVLLYLITSQMPRMEKKLLAELPAGARVVSLGFKFPNWPVSESNGKGVYLYKK